MEIGHAIRILLVEDDRAHAEIVMRNLRDFRVANKIVHVEDGQAALDYLYWQGPFRRARGRRPASSDPPGPPFAQGGRPGGPEADQGRRRSQDRSPSLS